MTYVYIVEKFDDFDGALLFECLIKYENVIDEDIAGFCIFGEIDDYICVLMLLFYYKCGILEMISFSRDMHV